MNETELSDYLQMTVKLSENLKPFPGVIENTKFRLRTALTYLKNHEPTKPVKEALREYFSNVNAINVNRSDDFKRRYCKTYLEVIKQLGLYEQLEKSAREVSFQA